MTMEAETSPSRPVERGAYLTNIAQAGTLLAGFVALLALILRPEFGNGGIVIALLTAAAIVVLATRIAPSSLMRFYAARPYEAGDLAQFDRITTELARRAGLRRTPRIYVVPSMLLSAFSMGSSRQFAIAVTEGLLRRLTMREVAAVLAREVAHAQRGDLVVLGIADWGVQTLHLLAVLVEAGGDALTSLFTGEAAHRRPASSISILSGVRTLATTRRSDSAPSATEIR